MNLHIVFRVRQRHGVLWENLRENEKILSKINSEKCKEKCFFS